MNRPKTWLLAFVTVAFTGGIGCGLFPSPQNTDLDPFIGAGPFGPFTGFIIDEAGNQLDAQGDEDGDSVPNIDDECVGVPGPVENAGCPLDDNGDADSDGVPNGADGCPFIAGPSQTGGCPLDPAADYDSDGVPNGTDACPFVAGTGTNGCPQAPVDPPADSDGDGVPDSLDGCPNNPFKIDPGVCGCDTPDTDSDGDGVPDCIDGCPNNPNKLDPGVCGCAAADLDSDFDGVPNCVDGCPNDPNKVDPGICGCGVADIDSDGDGVLDCQDDCPSEPGIGPNGCPLQGDLELDTGGVTYDVSIRPEGWSILTNLDAVLVRNPNTGQWFRLDDLTLKYMSSVWMINGVKQYYGVCKYPGSSAPSGCICGDGGCEDSMAQGDIRVFRWLLEQYVYNQGDILSWWVRFEVEEFDGTAEACVEFTAPLP